MKTNPGNEQQFESTYALLVRSEEPRRSGFEMLVYTILIACTTFAVAQFGRQTFIKPPRCRPPFHDSAGRLTARRLKIVPVVLPQARGTARFARQTLRPARDAPIGPEWTYDQLGLATILNSRFCAFWHEAGCRAPILLCPYTIPQMCGSPHCCYLFGDSA